MATITDNRSNFVNFSKIYQPFNSIHEEKAVTDDEEFTFINIISFISHEHSDDLFFFSSFLITDELYMLPLIYRLQPQFKPYRWVSIGGVAELTSFSVLLATMSPLIPWSRVHIESIQCCHPLTYNGVPSTTAKLNYGFHCVALAVLLPSEVGEGSSFQF